LGVPVTAAGVAIEATATGARLALPRRVLPPTLRNFGVVALGAGACFLAVGAGSFVEEGSGAASLFGPFAIVVWGMSGAVAIALGALLLKSRTTIELDADRVRVKEAAGPLVVQRRFRLGALSHLRVEVLPFKRGALPVPATGALPEGGVTILSAEVKGKGRQVLVFGYEEDAMHDVLAELNKRLIYTERC
jgi:hypothetical protein